MAVLRHISILAVLAAATAEDLNVTCGDGCLESSKATTLLQTHKGMEDLVAEGITQPEMIQMQGLEQGNAQRTLIGLHEVEQALRTHSSWKKLKLAFSLWINLSPDQVAKDMLEKWQRLNFLGKSYVQNAFSGILFLNMNFVQGFSHPHAISELYHWAFSPAVWKEPKQGETMEVVTFAEYARRKGQQPLPAFFANYYTGFRVPSWEDNVNHANAVKMLDASVALGRTLTGGGPVNAAIKELEPRFAFDEKAMMKASWDGFSFMGPKEIKYANNGFNGVDVVDRLVQKYATGGEVLGVLMSFSVFSAHLTYDGSRLHLDMSSLEKYTPLAGFAKLGGKAEFVPDGERLRTVKMQYDGVSYTSFDDRQVAEDFSQRSKLSGWRFAEKAIIASLLAMTNLVLHVKDLHLEIAAAFQAVTVDAFAADPKHPIRRLLDPFIHRSVQATNDNFKLLYEHHAAEFSLAPLSSDEQLKLINDFIVNEPLNLANMDMERYGALRGMDPRWSTDAAQTDPNVWGWRWHYRALKVQRLYKQHVKCWLSKHYSSRSGVGGDGLANQWWASMVKHIPALKRTTQTTSSWASSQLTERALENVLPTLMVWLSWIHEDVGHSAAAYVYNPVHTPMQVPADGVGVVAPSFLFNTLAYRGFVFLNRAKLLGSAPDFWFDQEVCTGHLWWRKCTTPKADKQCFTNLQNSLRALGGLNAAFSECDTRGFYSCVDRVETAVSS